MQMNHFATVEEDYVVKDEHCDKGVMSHGYGGHGGQFKQQHFEQSHGYGGQFKQHAYGGQSGHNMDKQHGFGGHNGQFGHNMDKQHRFGGHNGHFGHNMDKQHGYGGHGGGGFSEAYSEIHYEEESRAGKQNGYSAHGGKFQNALGMTHGGHAGHFGPQKEHKYKFAEVYEEKTKRAPVWDFKSIRD